MTIQSKSDSRRALEGGASPNDTQSVKSALIGVVSAVIATLIAIVGNYFVTYTNIEKPKIDLENKKAAIEAQRQALLLAPNISTTCSSETIDIWNRKVSCRTKNSGSYAIDVVLKHISIELNSDVNGDDFLASVTYPRKQIEQNNTFRLQPGAEGDHIFYINHDKKMYPDGMRADLGVSISFSYDTIYSAC